MKKILIVLLLIGIVFVSGCVKCGSSSTAIGSIDRECKCSGLTMKHPLYYGIDGGSADICIGNCEECNCRSYYELVDGTPCISSGPCDSIEFVTNDEICRARYACEWKCHNGNYCDVEFEIDKNYDGAIEDDERGLNCWDDPINVRCNINCNV